MLILLAAASLLVLLLLGATIAWEARHPPRRTLAWALANKRPADPSEIGLPYEEWAVDCPGGGSIPVWDVDLRPQGQHGGAPRTEAASPGSGPTLVLVHGWGRSRIDSLGRLSAVLEAAPGHFARALLPELRGHGESPAPTSRLGDGEEADLLALLRQSASREVVMAGHSLGATLVIRAAASGTPEANVVRSVIAWAPYEELATPLNNRLRAIDSVTRPFTDVALLLLRLQGIRRLRTSDAARRLRVPLLVIAGAQDVVSPLAECRSIAASAPCGRLVILEGAHPNMHAIDPAGHGTALRELLLGGLGKP